jgi:MATE family multidrug resistance protein
MWSLMLDLLNLGIPLVLARYSAVLMQAADAWMLGKVGSEELAALTPAGFLLLVPITFGAGMAAAVNTLAGQAFGKGPRGRPQCGRFCWAGIWCAIAFGSAVLALGPSAPAFFAPFGHEAAVQELEVAYFQPALWSVLPQAVAAAIGSYFIAIRRPFLPMIGGFAAAAANIVLNYALIFGNLGAPELGMAGAAIGTSIASYLYAALMLSIFVSRKNSRLFGALRPQIDFGAVRETLRVGAPMGFHLAIDILIWGIGLSWLVGHFGTADLAAATVLVRLMHFTILPSEGIGEAMMALVANEIGRRRNLLARRRVAAGFWLIAAYMMGVGVCFYLFRETIVSWFSGEPEVIAIASGAMVVILIAQFFDAVNIVYSFALWAVEDALVPSIVQTFSCIAILIGGGAIYIYIAGGESSLGIWIIDVVYLIAISGFLYFRWMTGGWEKRFPPPDPASSPA